MFEIFLFINPIGFYCYDTENKIHETVNELDLNACLHFVPLANVNIIRDDMIRRRCNAQPLCDFSFYTLTTNQALRAYHAIKIAYGNRKARQFLFTIQEKLNHGTNYCNLDLLISVMQEMRLNLERIDTLQKSEYVQDSINEDLALAKQWNIKKAPTTIIFNENAASESGILLEGKIEQNELRRILVPNTCKDEDSSSFQNMFSTSHLRLI